ncbi:MAG: amidohydrolase family protein [Candidatus Rokubacteria bacterium]|nr:amidohydrolase family protein [Candidatus Rokubacteria bacterium]
MFLGRHVTCALGPQRALRELGKPVEAEYVEGGIHAMTFRPDTAGRLHQRAIAFYRAQLLGTSASTQVVRPETSVAAPGASATSSKPAPAPAARAASGYSGPIFDAHAHMIRPGVGAMARPGGPRARPARPPQGTGGEVSPFEIVDRLRAAGVSGMFLFAAPVMVQRKYPDLVYAFVAAPHDPAKQGPSFTSETAALIDEKLRSEGARGIGELPLRHRPTGNAHTADGPVVMRIYELAARHNVPVTVHVEHEYSRELERAVVGNPKTVFIWAHVGSGPAGIARDLMRKYANLYADLSTRNPIFRMGIPVDQNSLTDASGRLKEEWRTVFEELPDRFLLGLDINNTERLQQLDELVAYYRAVLGELTPATAEKIAHRNARRLIGLE